MYEAVRQEIGTTRLHFQILDRYRTRCHWYNQEYLRKQVLTPDGTFVRDREDILTRDLALYLYDQGVTVLYKTKLGKHEVDLLELDAKHPMFIEVKAYKDSGAKVELVSGIGQLHAYLSKSEQPRLGHQTAEDAEGRREIPALIVLCVPLRPLRFDYLY